ncbi:hypothetical protein [Marmoricola sp. URHB0036]|uniref:hypothetical protein n=1 Tax=Marmoricola sp. URHB0036 TaxID=1298863 RepID=UPI0003F5AA95|nr:hypothetical protein [Marmoricola sp. URHB0036]
MLGRRGGALVLAAGMLATGCHSSGDETLGSAQGTAPPGTYRVTCELRSAHGGVTVALDLPTRYHRAHLRGQDCSWSTSMVDAAASNDLGTVRADLVVSLDHVPDAHPLREVYDEQAPNAIEGDDPEGDDSVLHLKLATDVPTFGRTRGDRLAWWCYCDGQNTLTRMVQAAGVRLTWTGVKSLEPLIDQSLATALRQAGTTG